MYQLFHGLVQWLESVGMANDAAVALAGGVISWSLYFLAVIAYNVGWKKRQPQPLSELCQGVLATLESVKGKQISIGGCQLTNQDGKAVLAYHTDPYRIFINNRYADLFLTKREAKLVRAKLKEVLARLGKAEDAEALRKMNEQLRGTKS